MSQSLKLVSYNLQNGKNEKAIIKSIKYLIALGVDIFCLQEVRKLPDKLFIGQIIKESLNENWKIEYFLGEDPYDFGACFIWNSSKLRLQNIEKIPLPSLKSLNLLERVIDKILINRTTPIKRGVLIGVFKLSNRYLRITNLHLDWQGGLKHRTEQLQYIINKLKQESFEQEVICGDFNMVGLPVSSRCTQQKIEDILGAEFKNVQPNLIYTINSIIPQKLDYILVKNINFKEGELIPLKGSDHYPLITILELKR